MSRRQRYTVLVLGAATLLLVLAFFVFLWRPALVVGVSGGKLGRSVGSEFTGKSDGNCV